MPSDQGPCDVHLRVCSCSAQVENIGVQIEQPFEVLPLPHFCAAIKKHVLDMVSIHAEAKALARREWPMTPSAMTPAMSPSPSQTVSPSCAVSP